MENKIAIVLLAFSDYEALELSLAAYAKNMHSDYKLFILQNGKLQYDCERTYRVALRYQKLFPDNIQVVDWIQPQEPYYAIKELLNSDELKEFEYICKVDDDVFPLRENWLENLAVCYKKSKEKYGNNLAYVTGLVNNNGWGFVQLLKETDLKDEFYKHFCETNHNDYEAYKDINAVFFNKEVVNESLLNPLDRYTGSQIWKHPYLARWIHYKTTYNPESYIQKSKEFRI